MSSNSPSEGGLTSPEIFMRHAIEISARALDDPGCRPYGGVVVKDGRIVGEGINRSVKDLDPTSHGETEAIRDACRTLGTTDLTGCTLYASCEPCPLCVAAMMIAGVDRMYYAVSLEESDAILAAIPGGDCNAVDVQSLRDQTAKPVAKRTMPSGQILSGEGGDVLRRWSRTA